MSGTSVKDLLTRYGGDATLIAGELAKKNAERKMLHEMLTEYGVPVNSANGEGMCLINRVLVAATRSKAIYPMKDFCGAKTAEGSICLQLRGHNTGRLDVPSNHGYGTWGPR